MMQIVIESADMLLFGLELLASDNLCFEYSRLSFALFLVFER